MQHNAVGRQQCSDAWYILNRSDFVVHRHCGDSQNISVQALFDPSVSKQLKQLALDEDSTVRQLLGEALDLLFQARGKPLIAQAPKS